MKVKKRRGLVVLMSTILLFSQLCTAVSAEEAAAETSIQTIAAKNVCNCTDLCTENRINENCPVCGSVGADLTVCKGIQSANRKDGTEKITETETSNSLKTIDSWKWVDDDGLIEDGTITVPMVSPENPISKENVIELLPKQIIITEISNGGGAALTIDIDKWDCANFPENGSYNGRYIFTVTLPDGYVLSKNAGLLELTVKLGTDDGNGINMYTSTGDFTVTGNSSSYTYDSVNHVLTITGSDPLTISGTTTADRIVVQGGVTANVTIDGLNIDYSKSKPSNNTPIIDVIGAALNLTIKNNNTFNNYYSGQYDSSCIHVPTGASIVINANDNKNDILNIVKAYSAAAIGGNKNESGGDITIKSGYLILENGAISDHFGAYIGGGYQGNGGNIVISGGVIEADTCNNGIGKGEGGSDNGTFSTGSNGKALIMTNYISDVSGINNWGGFIVTKDNAGVFGVDFTLNQTIYLSNIPKTTSFNIKEGTVLTISENGKFRNQSTIISNKGTIINKGEIRDLVVINDGTINNYNKCNFINGSNLAEGSGINNGTINNYAGGQIYLVKDLTNNGEINNHGKIIEASNAAISGIGVVNYESKTGLVFLDAETVDFDLSSADEISSVKYGDKFVLFAGIFKVNGKDESTESSAIGMVEIYLGDKSTGTKIGELSLTDGCGYTYIDVVGDNWKPSGSPYTITAYFDGVAMGSESLFASKESKQLAVTEQNGTIPNISIDYINEKLTGFVSGGSYTVNGNTVNITDGKLAIDNSWYGTTISVIKKGNGTTITDSPAQTLSIPSRPSAPSAGQFTVTQPSAVRGTGSVAGITSSMEYSLDGGNTWINGNGSVITNIPQGKSCFIRIKAADSNFRSEICNINIDVYNTVREQTPNISVDFDNGMLLGFENGAIYTINGSSVSPVGGKLKIDNSWYGTTISVIKKGNGVSTIDSYPQDIVIKSLGTSPSVSTGNTSDKKNNKPESGGSRGWSEIKDKIKEAEEGSKIIIDMNGTTELPKDIVSVIKGRDIDIVLDMGNDITWTVNGKSVTSAKTVDMGIRKNTKTIPVDVINTVTGEKYTIQISLAHEGDFGFTALLTIDLGKENDGLYANLFYYNWSEKKLEFLGSDKINSGKAELTFTHASDYAIVIAESPLGTGNDLSAGEGISENNNFMPLENVNISLVLTGFAILISVGILTAGLSVIRKKK